MGRGFHLHRSLHSVVYSDRSLLSHLRSSEDNVAVGVIVKRTVSKENFILNFEPCRQK